MNKCNIIRIHLKTGGAGSNVDRKSLINFCLNKKGSQCIAIGWSSVYEKASFPINSFDDYYRAVKEYNQKKREKDGGTYRINPAINRFSETKENDLFWTRDLDGNYWICRAKGKAKAYCDTSLDIGAIVPTEAYMYGIEVPGQISTSFSRSRGGITEILKDDVISAFSQKAFNKLSGRTVYTVNEIRNNDILDNLPPLDLEELVISYIQIIEGYYVLSNSIANRSTTIKIECEFRSRDKHDPKKAVVQVKGGRSKQIDAEDYKAYDEQGYAVYFFAPYVLNIEKLHNGIWITRDQLMEFYEEYKAVLPDSITKWESI